MSARDAILAYLGYWDGVDTSGRDEFTAAGELTRGGAETARRAIGAGLSRRAPPVPAEMWSGKFCGISPAERLEYLVRVGRALAPRLLLGDFHSDETQRLIREVKLAEYLPDGDAEEVKVGMSGSVVNIDGTWPR